MAGFHIGNVIGLLITPIMLSTIGIFAPFILFTSIGLLWVMTWSYQVTDDPSESNFISRSELRLIQSGKIVSPKKSNKFPPLGLILSKLPSWAIIFANATNNWVSFFAFE
jgi:ACS family sodium-dependent inorganic phosphate cotransporter